jgi:Fe-Mn family superoxide dismutase
MKEFGVADSELKKVIRESLGLKNEIMSPADKIDEAYVTQAKKFTLSTEFLSDKSKRAHYELFNGYVDSLNKISAELDAADRENANANDSIFRSLKIDEIDNLNASFLHGLFFENISDLHSELTMDSITFMRLERDFGTFDAWQKDFIACAMSSRNGWAVTVYNTFLQRYINVCVDLDSANIPFSSFPIIVVDCWEHSYYRDYLNDRKTYVFAMMKELAWDVIEKRVKQAEKIGKISR